MGGYTEDQITEARAAQQHFQANGTFHSDSTQNSRGGRDGNNYRGSRGGNGYGALTDSNSFSNGGFRDGPASGFLNQSYHSGNYKGNSEFIPSIKSIVLVLVIMPTVSPLGQCKHPGQQGGYDHGYGNSSLGDSHNLRFNDDFTSLSSTSVVSERGGQSSRRGRGRGRKGGLRGGFGANQPGLENRNFGDERQDVRSFWEDNSPKQQRGRVWNYQDESEKQPTTFLNGASGNADTINSTGRIIYYQDNTEDVEMEL
jgi:hypothetical protein